MWSLLSLILRLQIPHRPLMLLLQAALSWTEQVCTHAHAAPPASNYMVGKVQSLLTKTDRRVTVLLWRAPGWGTTPGGDEGPPLFPTRMPANENHVPAMLFSPISHLQQHPDMLKNHRCLGVDFWSHANNHWDNFLWGGCLFIYICFLLCFVSAN